MTYHDQASAERSSALVELARSAGSLGDLELLSLLGKQLTPCRPFEGQWNIQYSVTEDLCLWLYDARGKVLAS